MQPTAGPGITSLLSATFGSIPKRTLSVWSDAGHEEHAHDGSPAIHSDTPRRPYSGNSILSRLLSGSNRGDHVAWWSPGCFLRRWIKAGNGLPIHRARYSGGPDSVLWWMHATPRRSWESTLNTSLMGQPRIRAVQLPLRISTPTAGISPPLVATSSR